jgi:hypothetical protein
MMWFEQGWNGGDGYILPGDMVLAYNYNYNIEDKC